jgi:membrane-bound serine protease (ClpP class)
VTLFASLLLILSPAFAAPQARPQARPRVLLAEYDGIIVPVAAEYISAAVSRAESEKFDALVLQLDTPGGLDLSMRQAIKAILSSRVPVIVYVAPAGARAASAGVFITEAAHVAAMAPGTNIGAAHPVFIGQAPQKKEEKDETLEKKIAQDAEAYLVSIVRERGRNVGWAAHAVSQSTSTPATEALQLKVIDLVADSLDHLLDQADGRDIPSIGKLRTKGAEVVKFELTRRQKLLETISDPNVAVILMSLGAAGIFIELYSPGLIFPGIIGVLSLVLAFYSFQTLSANFAGVALILFGFLLFVLEVKLTSHGLLSVGGTIAMLLGFLMLFEQPGLTGIGVHWTVVASMICGLLAVTATLAWLYAKASRRRPQTGHEALIGMEGVARGRLAPNGSVFVNGEIWRARVEDGQVADGEAVKVVSQRGLTLTVKKIPT